MKLQNDYKILYEKITEEEKSGYATKNLPWDETNSKVSLRANDDEVKLSDYKLIYEKDGFIYGSLERIPTDADDMISGLDEEGNVIFGVGVVPPPATDPIVRLNTTVESKELINFGVPFAPGTKDVEVKIRGIADGTYNVSAVDATGASCEIDYHKETDMDIDPPYSCVITITEMPATNVTVNFEIQ